MKKWFLFEPTPIANCSVNRILTFDEEINLENNTYVVESSEHVSAAQEALVRVCESILRVWADDNGEYFARGGIVSCELLADKSVAGWKGVEEISKDIGCIIKISNNLPPCASPGDEIVKIDGDMFAVKRALLAIACHLQDSPSFGHAEIGSLIVFRMLCSKDRVGGLIGNSREVIQALENESGASILVETPTSSDYSVITCTAMESPKSQNSFAQYATILVFTWLIEVEYEKGLDSQSSRTDTSTRLLITHNQSGCLLGETGSIIEEMRKITGPAIKIYPLHRASRFSSVVDEAVYINEYHTYNRGNHGSRKYHLISLWGER